MLTVVQPDPRPLIGEPLPLDLLDTHWIADGDLQDLLATPEGVERWLATALEHDATLLPTVLAALGVEGPALALAPTPEVIRALRVAREAVEAAAKALPGSDELADTHLNSVLRHGSRSPRLGPGGPGSVVLVDDPAWFLPYLAAERFVDLVATVPDRIRQCVHPQCVLWYLDTSRSRTRRWCSMSICGNRTKVDRHQRRARGEGAGVAPG